MCATGANGPKCPWERGFNGDVCVKPKHITCPLGIDGGECESTERKNSGEEVENE